MNPPGNPEVRVFDGPGTLVEAAAGEFVRRVREAVDRSGRCAVALAGGSTPRPVYEALAAKPAAVAPPWERVHFFWGDERPVPAGHPDSNYRMAREALLGRIDVPDANVHPIDTARGDPDAVARAYEDELRSFFAPAAGELPRFDLVLLGMGEDGHTASLFPGSPALLERERLVAANWVARLDTHRYTLTFPVLDAAACVVFLVSGERKAFALARVLNPSGDDVPPPAARVRPSDGEVLWLVDSAAAGGLEPTR